MSLRSPRSPTGHRGFRHIPSSPGSDVDDMMEPNDIPLQPVRTNATTSSSTGARKLDQTLSNALGTVESPPTTEKHGLFHKSSKSSRRQAGPSGRRRVRDLSRPGTNMSEEKKFNALGRMYRKIVSFPFVTRYLIYIIPIAFLLAIPLFVLPFTGNVNNIQLGTSDDDKENYTLFWLFLWIEISWLSLWTAKLVAHFLPWVFMFLCGVVSAGTRKYANVLAALEINLSLFLWSLASWLVFKFRFTDDSLEWVHTIKRILLSVFISLGVLLGEKAIVQLISISYHQRSFANRIQDSKRDIYLLGLLYDASRTLFPMYCPEFVDEDYVISDSINALLMRDRAEKARGGTSTPMRLVGDVGRIGDKITSVFGNLASEITGKNVFNPTSAHSIVIEALEKVRSSEAMARRIWMSFAAEGEEALLLDDIIEVLGAHHREEAEECFHAIDADQNGDISLDEMIRKVVDIGKERKAIAHSMKDISQALTVFDKVLLFVVLIIVIIIFLVVFQSSFVTTLATAGTTLLSLSFVFAVTTQEFLGSCIFLFVKHPYDVGDRVDIKGPDAQQFIVEKISLLYTVFTRIDKMQVVQVPNIQLNNLWIENVTRSKAMKETVDVAVSYDTSFEEIELLRLELEKFVRSPENSRDFQPDITIMINDIGNLDKMTLKIQIKHKSNWHNEAVRCTRRSKFMCALALALKAVPINAPGGGGEALGGPTNPAYSVAVTDDFAAMAREKADKDKEAAKMVTKLRQEEDVYTPGSGITGTSKIDAEKQAVANINASDPVAEALDDWGYDRVTLRSRDNSPVGRAKADDASSMARRNHLNPRESQRGRRKPGDGLPPTPLGNRSLSVHVTRPSVGGGRGSIRSPNTGRRSNLSFDVERGEAGFSPDPYTGQGYAGQGQPGPSMTQYAGAAYAAQQQQQQQAMSPSSPSVSGGLYAGQSTLSPHAQQPQAPEPVYTTPGATATTIPPVQSLPTPSPITLSPAPVPSGTSGTGGPVGARPRGASMYNPTAAGLSRPTTATAAAVVPQGQTQGYTQQGQPQSQAQQQAQQQGQPPPQAPQAQLPGNLPQQAAAAVTGSDLTQTQTSEDQEQR
ncbi:Mechanosensitive ion channel-domain-containing protein [Copromyces sp. CBS 386.78]|nr:Mechanosensitive ion channel-domain-containing protein [Copromyces sp. CBS 386.78]